MSFMTLTRGWTSRACRLQSESLESLKKTDSDAPDPERIHARWQWLCDQKMSLKMPSMNASLREPPPDALHGEQPDCLPLRRAPAAPLGS